MASPSRRDDLLLRLVFTGPPIFLFILGHSNSHILTYTPRGLIYSHEVLPFFLAPFAVPETVLTLISRLIQWCLLFLLPLSAAPYLWLFWMSLAAIRALVGYLLTRSVGWAYPSLFSHWALYESASGLGPSLLAYFGICGTEKVTGILPPKFRRNEWLLIPSLTILFCWLEHRPWTYGIALLCIAVLQAFFHLFDVQTSYVPLPTVTTTNARPIRSSLKTIGLSFIAVVVPYILFDHLPKPPRLPLPSPPNPQAPLLEILILTFPRPAGIEVSAQLLSTTIVSFVPYLAPKNVILSTFTHSPNHEAFKQVQQVYTDRQDMFFHVDTDSHPNDTDGHYVHLAEAFRWVLEKDPSRRAEWIMLAEDDFPVCGGTEGWDVITTVVNMLETDRLSGVAIGAPNLRAGFIGTGGSGIIIHHSYLRLLIMLLRTYSSLSTPLPPNIARRAPDLVVQDCILGRQFSLCERQRGVNGKTIISSRIVMDHIGGMATTTSGKGLNSDKWRCGWRHPFHGDEAVDVVVV
ncbi:hypothetical protein BXZ70DRAFT_944846 [Cristinia sonorae]|uniref:Uncharacterized protein n=1 Tax=Cristinia sonorae TaxID=1940300 RepID=A0A8K0UK72_9AGAR|nr:hypothetical protein BXZ70DRAFT_944846 [Cristinia sonorae]